MTYRLVATLEQHALVRRDARGRVLLGLGCSLSPWPCSRCCATSPCQSCAGSPTSSVPPPT
ncbi:MAG: hypothetical protein R2734_08715 [Nocardioides sp.]